MKKKEATFLENLWSSLPAVKNGVAMVEGEATIEAIEETSVVATVGRGTKTS